MSVDEEFLKVRIAKAAAFDGPWDQTLLTTPEWRWVRAALEDRDRLRANAEQAADEVGNLREALNNEMYKRDRLREAMLEILTLTQSGSTIRQIARVALEGRDG